MERHWSKQDVGYCNKVLSRGNIFSTWAITISLEEDEGREVALLWLTAQRYVVPIDTARELSNTACFYPFTMWLAGRDQPPVHRDVPVGVIADLEF